MLMITRCLRFTLTRGELLYRYAMKVMCMSLIRKTDRRSEEKKTKIRMFYMK